MGIAQVTVDGGLLRFNDATCAIFGRTREELETLSVADFTHPEDLAPDLEQAARVLAGEIGSYRLEKRLVRGDGGLSWVDLSVSLVRDEGGEPLYFVSAFEDVTARKAAEEALRASEARQRFLDELGQATADVEGAEEAMLVASRMLGRHLGVSRCELRARGGGRRHVPIPGGHNDGVEPIVGSFRLSSFGPEMAAQQRRGGASVVRDVVREFGSPEALGGLRRDPGALVRADAARQGRAAGGAHVRGPQGAARLVARGGGAGAHRHREGLGAGGARAGREGVAGPELGARSARRGAH